MNTTLRALALGLLVTLGGCGGGGDAAPQTFPSVATVEAFAMCGVAAAAAGAQVQRVTVAQDAYTYPDTSGVQDRSFAPAAFANTTGQMVTIQVVLSSSRTLTAPVGLVGTTELDLALIAFDLTANQFINDPGMAALRPTDPVPAGCLPELAAVAAGEVKAVSELRRLNVAVPPGHTVNFWSLARVIQSVGSVGHIQITTTGLDLSVIAL